MKADDFYMTQKPDELSHIPYINRPAINTRFSIYHFYPRYTNTLVIRNYSLNSIAPVMRNSFEIRSASCMICGGIPASLATCMA